MSSAETAVIASGVRYLRIEARSILESAACSFYGYYRAIKRAEMSVVLTVISPEPCVTRLYVLSATFLGRDRNLDGDPDRLDTGRSHRTFIHEKDLVKRKGNYSVPS